jgi:hypothetical protein
MSEDEGTGKNQHILMPVTPDEAKRGAFSDLWHPLSKKQAQQKVNLKAFWLILLLGGLGIGIIIEVLK